MGKRQRFTKEFEQDAPRLWKSSGRPALGPQGCLQSKPLSSWLLEIAEIQAQAEDATGAL